MVYLVNKELNQALEAIQRLMYDTIGSFYVFDTNNTVLCCNKTQLDWIGYTDASELIGKTFEQTPWGEFANHLRNNNQQVLASNKAFSFYEHAYTGTEKYIRIALSEKKPFYHKGDLIGVMGSSLALPLDQLSPTKTLTEYTIFIDTYRQRKIVVSPKKRRTLFFALQGHTSKQIAELINLSKRTVEHHLESIKHDNGYTSLRNILLYVRAF